MSIVRKIKRALRGEVNAKTATLEVFRRSSVKLSQKRERVRLAQAEAHQLRLRALFANMSGPELLDHFRGRSTPLFLAGFNRLQDIAGIQRLLFPQETNDLVAAADQIVTDHSWSLMGLGTKRFGPHINWNRDPVSEVQWPLEFHADMTLLRGDGSDVRVLWELNRLSHFITLARAYAVTGDDRFTIEFLRQLESWQAQNNYGFGANWNCAMEVALRAMNLLGAFQSFVGSKVVDEAALIKLLSMLEQHGRFIRRNLEFSFLATSNHYLSDVVGLVWLGTMLPELEMGEAWRDFGLREMLREMDKQVLPDGADFESSTGYHRFVLELFLYTFILCRANGIAIEQRYWEKLRAMLVFTRACVRPDGRAPLIGDSDGGQVLPIRLRDGDDHAYVLAVGAASFGDASLMPELSAPPEEVLWILGQEGVDAFKKLKPTQTLRSSAFPNAGFYILRDGDLSLSLNASGAGIDGRGSHGHNDALSLEVSACGVPFVTDPGTYVYTADLKERNRFRATAYHSSVQIDGAEQSTIDEQTPFVIGNEASPVVLVWESSDQIDLITAEHYGYMRLQSPVRHRRTVIFNKEQRWWRVEDEFLGSGRHSFAARFHLNAGIEVSHAGDQSVSAYDKMTGARLLINSVDLSQTVEFEEQYTSRNYYQKTPSITACWKFQAEVPFKVEWVLLPTCNTDDDADVDFRLSQAKSFIADQ